MHDRFLCDNPKHPEMPLEQQCLLRKLQLVGDNDLRIVLTRLKKPSSVNDQLGTGDILVLRLAIRTNPFDQVRLTVIKPKMH